MSNLANVVKFEQAGVDNGDTSTSGTPSETGKATCSVRQSGRMAFCGERLLSDKISRSLRCVELSSAVFAPHACGNERSRISSLNTALKQHPIKCLAELSANLTQLFGCLFKPRVLLHASGDLFASAVVAREGQMRWKDWGPQFKNGRLCVIVASKM